LFEWMTTLNFPQLPQTFRKMKSNNVKALLFSGSLDGRTYLSSGIDIAQKFNNGQHIIVENAGHDLYMESPQIRETILDFFKGKRIETERIAIAPTLFD
ncbi:MAG: alpha/beta hydrolase, partial [Bacteroidota bacterium]